MNHFTSLHSLKAASSASAPLLEALTAELTGVVPSASLKGFYQSVGRRMAAAVPLDGVDDLGHLTSELNALWKKTAWGCAEIALEPDAIVVRHSSPPEAPSPGCRDAWFEMVPAVLEGAYDSWFRSLGSGPTLHTRAKWNGDAVELRHSR